MLQLLKYLWASPATVLGVVVAFLSRFGGGRIRVVRGALEVSGGFAAWMLDGRPFRASAMTLGHVIVGQDEWSLDISRDHEHVHVRQYEKWGPLFIPLYIALSILAWMRGKHFYFDNPFEREAYDEAG